jgi:membrane protein YdbS with pleckstrin-like domain
VRARAERGPRGRWWLQAAAFGLVLVAAYLQFRGNLDSSLQLVWASIAASAVALLTAVASVVVPGRPLRPVDDRGMGEEGGPDRGDEDGA